MQAGYRTNKKYTMIYGINLGSGSGWQLSHWQEMDQIGGRHLDAETILPFDDSSIRWVYSSYFFEHIDDNTADNLIAESYRILKPGGILRIIVPDFELFIQKYLENDEKWYREITRSTARPEWEKYKVADCLSNLLLDWIANHDFEGSHGPYCGPPIGVSEDDVKYKAKNCDTEDFCEWAQGLIQADDPHIQHNHINWWDVQKFLIFFKASGFRIIFHSDYMQSDARVLLKDNKNMFDSWKPNREHCSIYMETIK